MVKTIGLDVGYVICPSGRLFDNKLQRSNCFTDQPAGGSWCSQTN
jgi:hypothetical protein